MPITRGDDGLLYTAYGDGSGFEPFVNEKVNLGFASETSSIPPKWISTDGRRAYLVFSRNDAFSVRQMRFILRKPH